MRGRWWQGRNPILMHGDYYNGLDLDFALAECQECLDRPIAKLRKPWRRQWALKHAAEIAAEDEEASKRERQTHASRKKSKSEKK